MVNLRLVHHLKHYIIPETSRYEA